MLNFLHHVREKYSSDTSKATKLYINISKKIEKCHHGMDFINTCLNNNVHPNFSRINLADDQLKQNKRFTNTMRNNITEQVLQNKRRHRNKLISEQIGLKAKLVDLNTIDRELLDKLVKEKRETIKNSQTSIHEKKLADLGIQRFKVDSKHINKRRNKLQEIEKYEEVDSIFNLSKTKILNSVEKRVLSKGLKFGISCKKVNEFEILARFEELAQSLDYLEINDAQKEDELKANLNSKTTFFNNLQNMASEFIQLSKKAMDNLTSEEHTALKALATDKSIVITKADKGNAVVIQDLSDYQNKVNEILLGCGKFEKLSGDYTGSRENKLQVFFREHKKLRRKGIDKRIYSSITPCGSRAGVLYGLPKIHKNGAPIRPIISAVKTYNYKVAKFMVKILSPFLDNSYVLTDSFDFINKIPDLNTRTDASMVSFDVESLFTNVPTLETIDIILDEVFKPREDLENEDFELFFGLVLTAHGFTREELKRLLTICTQESHFQFNGEFFDQIDGVAMGSPLGPLFANFFMSNFERKYMPELRKMGVEKWYRYVDDVFATLRMNANIDEILSFLNSRHPNIKFTTELESNNKLPFLDVYVVRRVNKYITTVYRKKTFTGVYLNWNSLTSRKYKIGLINNLLNRIFRSCTRVEDRNKEIATLKSILTKNDYPTDVINKTVELFMNRKNNIDPQMTDSTTREPIVEKKTRFIVLPFSNRKVEEFGRRLNKLVTNNYPQVDFNIAFQPPMTIGSMFPFKDTVKVNNHKSLVIYKIKCKTCGAEYIGRTERILQYRINEHKSKAASNKSATKKHTDKYPGHQMDYDNVEIIDHADNPTKLDVKELLHILKTKPEINRQLGSQSSYEIKTILIQAYPQHRKKP